MRTFVSVEHAREVILDRVTPVETESVPLSTARGRTLRDPVHSSEDIPPFDNAAMDGYAVRAADIDRAGTSLPLAFDVTTGSSVPPLPADSCAAITTGNPLPPEADAVVRKERTEANDQHIRFDTVPSTGQNVRPAGEDVPADTVVLKKGTVVDAAAASLMASVGHTQPTVSMRPRTLVLVTGDELVAPSQSPGPGQIRDANGPSLAMRVESAGGKAHLSRSPDDETALREVLHDAPAPEVILVSGGMSTGRDDLARRELERMGLDLHFWKVKQRPGKPFAFGMLEECPVFGLPGNPVAAAVCFEVYVRPALAAMLGRRTVLPPLQTAVLEEGYRVKEGYHYFSRGIAHADETGQLRVRTTGHQGSGISSSMRDANCLIHLDEDVVDPEAGRPVSIQWL